MSVARVDEVASRHRSAVVSAEIRRIANVLSAIGPMPRGRLMELCGAKRWREGSFDEAVAEGVRQGRLRELPLGWVESTTIDRFANTEISG